MHQDSKDETRRTTVVERMELRFPVPLRDRFRAWAQHGIGGSPGSIDPGEAAMMVRPYTWLLDRIGVDGLELTKAGRLPPKVVFELMHELGWANEWIGKMNREEQTQPALELRESATRLGLVRKYRGKLLAAKQVQPIADIPKELLQLIATRLPTSYRDSAENDVLVFMLIAVAIGGYRSRREYAEMLAESLDAVGYRQTNGDPLTTEMLKGSVYDQFQDLERLKVFRDPRFRRDQDPDYRATEAGRAFARLALLS